MSWDAMLRHEADTARIKEDHGHIQGQYESRMVEHVGNRYATVSLRQGHRRGFWDGVFWVLGTQQRIEDLTDTELLTELRKRGGSIFWPVKAGDPRFWADCPGCDRPVLIDAEGICDTCAHNFGVPA